MTKETRQPDKRDIIPFIIFRPECSLNFRDRLCWSLLVYRRRRGRGCKEHQIVTRTGLGRKGVHAALERLSDQRLVYKRGPLYYARKPRGGIAVLKKDCETLKWFKRFAFWKCTLDGKRPTEDVLLALLRSLARKNAVARNQSDAGLATLIGVHPRTLGRAMIRLEKEGRVKVNRKGVRYDVRLIVQPTQTAASAHTESPFDTGFRLLKECRVPAKLLRGEIIPLVERLNASDISFGLPSFLSLIEDACDQHGQTGQASHPGHLVRHKLQRLLPGDGGAAEKAADIRRQQEMAEIEARCRAGDDYWSVIAHLGMIDHVSCCGSRIRLEGGREVRVPTAKESRVAEIIQERLPGDRVIVKEYRLRCPECRAVHRCRTAHVFTAINGWSSFRHVLLSQRQEEPANPAMTAKLLPADSKVGRDWPSRQDSDEQAFQALLDAVDLDSQPVAIANPKRVERKNLRIEITEEKDDTLIPKGLFDDIYYTNKTADELQELAPVLQAVLTTRDDDEEEDHAAVFTD